MRRNLQSVLSIAEQGPFTEGQLRWWIFNAASNGLAKHGAIVRVQRRIYLDLDRFGDWIDSQNSTAEAAA